MVAVTRVLVLLSLVAFGAVAERKVLTVAAASANPIRKVVSMLQAMQKQVEKEGEEEKALYDKFMCYCKTGGGTLSDGISAAETKVPAVTADIKEAEEKNAQLKDDLKEAQADRAAAKSAMKDATAIRDKESYDFAALKADADANIAALTKAVAAIEAGAAGGFLQTSAAQVIQKLAKSMQDASEKQDVLAFLSGSYAPKSGQITGILKQMGDTMNSDLADATSTENAAIKAFDQLMAIKTKEVASLTAAIESKIKRIGELSVDIVEMKQDLKDTSAALEEDQKFLGDLEGTCKKKSAEWEERVATRGLEIEALADTIKILNDDDALELFKKTLPGASSFVQVGVSSAAVRARAVAAIQEAQARAGSAGSKLDFILLAVRGKSAGFEKVLKMIDEMTVLLKKEQQDDDDKKEYCSMQFDHTEDKKKGLDRQFSDEDAAIESAKEAIATLSDEMKALEAGIVALDKSVAEATEQRKMENVEFKALISSDTAAKELLSFAKNRLNKFYNPRLYTAPPKKELSAEDRIVANMGSFVQISSHTDTETAPPPPPETFGAYKTSGKSTGVIGMIDLLLGDMDKEMTEATQEEKDSQSDYEGAMRDSAEKRTLDSKSLAEKGANKADTEADLEATEGSKKETTSELFALGKYIQSLHGECDWLLMSFDARKEARTGEIDSLVKAKAILSGADFSLVQKSRHLRASK